MAIVPQTATPAHPGRRWNPRLYDGGLAHTARFRADLRTDLSVLPDLSPDLLSDIELCGTEMLANAVEHTRSGQEGGRVIRALSASSAPGSAMTLRLSVIDDGLTDDHAPTPGIPTQRTGREWQEAENGRGLLLLHHLATAWGTRPVVALPFCAGLGAVFWAEFTHPSPTGASR
ncbi:ATP-binding protein [Nocardiopsis sp. FR6]|uniref:ATP-binding protein n=1 Tax=Nocardiopsis sp. FR6 TaxID=2605986 RepID=UPI00135A2ED0|nr:ATP-binding protein [Nocardiopsis sp. FR6]